MAVVAVGDFKIEKIETLIQTHFNRLKVSENPKQRKEFPVPDHKETLVALATDPEAPYTSVNITYKFKKEEEVTKSDYKKRITKNLFSKMFKNRLEELVKSSEPPFIYGTSYFNSMIRTKDGFVLFAVVNDDDDRNSYLQLNSIDPNLLIENVIYDLKGKVTCTK